MQETTDKLIELKVIPTTTKTIIILDTNVYMYGPTDVVVFINGLDKTKNVFIPSCVLSEIRHKYCDIDTPKKPLSELAHYLEQNIRKNIIIGSQSQEMEFIKCMIHPSNDSIILAYTERLMKEMPQDTEIVLITSDTFMRIRAKGLIGKAKLSVFEYLK